MTSTTASSSSSQSSALLDGAVVISDDSLACFQLSSPPSFGSHSSFELLFAGEIALLTSPDCGALPEPLLTMDSSLDSTTTPLCMVRPHPYHPHFPMILLRSSAVVPIEGSNRGRARTLPQAPPQNYSCQARFVKKRRWK
ncbi:hypothetical protein COCNU_scaffold007662G000010 [Cocos nucifera]|nr:hypothetical protein [Cocos nucifera]